MTAKHTVDTAMEGILVQLNVSQGGMPKTAVGSSQVTRDGVAGDWQKNRKYHGGEDRAICIFSEENYRWLRDEHGIDLRLGSLGENFSTRGIDLQQLSPGDRLRVGQCLVEITDVRVPCGQLKMWHPDLKKIIEGRSGWMAKVVEEGEVCEGDGIEVVEA